MKLIYWNTLFLTEPEPLFERLMFFHQSFKKIDYFCLTEATTPLVTLFKQNGWQTFYIDNTSQRGILIASKHPLHKKRTYLLSEVERKGQPNKNHLMMIETYWQNKPLTIALTHLTLWRPREILRRRAERQKMAKILPKNRTLFGGDLNTIILPFAKWDVERVGYKSKVKGKTWRWQPNNRSTYIPLKLQLDHIFGTNDIQDFISAEILKEQKVSDHFPILVKLH